MSEARPVEGGWFRLRERQLAVAMTLVAVGAVTALVIVATVKGADALATVALSLAILAFIIQVIFFIAQTLGSTAINSQTSALLAELAARLEGMSTAVAGQQQLLGTVIRDSVARGKQSENPGDSLNLQEALRAVPQASPVSNESTSLSPEAQQQVKHLRSFPTQEEALRSWETLRSLSPLAMAYFQRFADDERDSLRQNLEPGLPVASARRRLAEELAAKGLLEQRTPADASDTRPWFRLTLAGREAARILLGQGRAPEYLADLT